MTAVTGTSAGVTLHSPAVAGQATTGTSGLLRNTLHLSSFVPLACPSERETTLNSAVQRLRYGNRPLPHELGHLPFSIVRGLTPSKARSDLKSVRSPDRHRSQPPESVLPQRQRGPGDATVLLRGVLPQGITECSVSFVDFWISHGADKDRNEGVAQRHFRPHRSPRP